LLLPGCLLLEIIHWAACRGNKVVVILLIESAREGKPEYGVVKLRYKCNVERAKALISIAHPDFRDELREGLIREGMPL
jgi:hypothetical protein